MTELEVLILGYGLGVVPASKTAQIVVAALGKRLGVRPQEIEAYGDATEGSDGQS
jgi:hypothetical protein